MRAAAKSKKPAKTKKPAKVASPPKAQEFVVGPDQVARLDKFLVERMPDLSRTYLQKLIKAGHVKVEGRDLPAGALLSAGEKVTITIPNFVALPAAASSVPILFEDKEMIVVDKPAGMVVHPAGPHQEDTLIQCLWPKLAPAWKDSIRNAALHTARPGVVHRLDKGTSGVMVIAKTPKAAETISKQFAARTTKKTYWALVQGHLATETGVIKSTVGRDQRKPHKMSTTDPGRPSELEFTVLARFENPPRALLEVRPLTGRTHQIRVQLAALGHALVGDPTYGGEEGDRPLLHALSLSFTHPTTKKRASFSTPLPADFQKTLKALGYPLKIK